MTPEKEQPREYTALSAEEWKRKYAELEVQLTEKTADLHLKSRELEIEAALERVRSRTMAMQCSDELEDAAILLFQQIKDLGINTWTTGFNVWLDGDNAYQDWLTTPEGGFIEPYIVDLTQYPVFMKIRDAKLRGDEFYVGFEDKNTIKETYKQLMKFAPDQFGKLLTDGFQFPTQQYDHFVFGKKVSLLFITYEPVPEAHDIFKRFGKVFEQTYTRFLDLQKAEAQAREAQIETAVERVRARAMAMHKSEDLKTVVVTLYEQLKNLGFQRGLAAINIMDSDTGDIDCWTEGVGDDYDLPGWYHVPFLHIKVICSNWNIGKMGQHLPK